MKTKRFLSITLSIMILLSLVPNAFAFEDLEALIAQQKAEYQQQLETIQTEYAQMQKAAADEAQKTLQQIETTVKQATCGHASTHTTLDDPVADDGVHDIVTICDNCNAELKRETVKEAPRTTEAKTMLKTAPLLTAGDEGTNTYTVTLTATPSEGGTVTGAGTYSDGETVTISTSANEGYRFDHWKRGDGSLFVETASHTFIIHNNLSLVAVFVEVASNVSSYTLAMPQSVTISPNAVTTAFTVNVPALDLQPNASGNTPESFRVKINAATLVNQSDAEKTISFKLCPYDETVGTSDTLYFRFDRAQSKNGYIVITDSQWNTATPGVYTGSMTYQPYYQYSNGNVEWLETTKSIPVTLTIPEPAITYTVTVNNGSGGGEYAAGASVTITANEPETGKQFNKWTGADGLTFTEGSATTATATFTMPAEAVTLTATYSETGIIPGEYALTLDPNYENKPVDYITGISSYTLPSLQRTYYDFLGWAESSDGAVRYHAGETVTLEGNLKLFAKWEGNNIPPSYSLSPTEYTLSGSGYTDIPCTLTSIEAGWISEISGGRLVEAIAEVIGFYMNGGTLTDGSGHSIPFLVDNPWHTTGPQQRAIQQREFNMDQQGVTVGMAIYIDPDVFSQAAPGTYTGTFTYDSYWRSYSANTGEVAGESGSIALTLVVPEPEVYTVTVNNGTGSGNYAEGVSVTITANDPETGKQFKEWTGVDGLTFVEGSSATTSTAIFTMPAKAVTLTATYDDIPNYTLNVTAPTFDEETVGYSQPLTKAITITSTGNSDATISGVALSGTNADSFTLTNGTASVTAGGTNTSYTVQPKTGLAAGTYTATITVTYNDGATATADVSFTVEAVPEAVAAPTFSPAAGAVASGTEITISCETEGARILYDITGSGDPSVEYTGPITITEATTITAIALRDDMSPSSLVTAAYTIQAPTPTTYAVTVAGGTADKASAAAGESVTITANDPETGKAFVQWAHVDGVSFANASSTETTFIMPAKDVTVAAVYAPILIGAIGDKTYTGSFIEPADEVMVSLDGVDLVLTAEDYKVTFENNVNAGDATVIVTFLAPRTGTKSVTFKILPADISGAEVNVADQVYNGTAVEPKPTVTWNGNTLTEEEDYTLSYNANTGVGTATVTLTGKGNFTGTKPATFTIGKGEDPAVVTATANVLKGGKTVDLSKNVTGAVGNLSFSITQALEGCSVNQSTGVFTSGSVTGECIVQVTIWESTNYKARTETITVTVSEEPQYPIEVKPAEGGKIETEQATAAEGDTVTLTVKPDEGYKVDTITVKNGEETIAVTEGENGTYTYTAPAAPVTVTVTFVKQTFTILFVDWNGTELQKIENVEYGDTPAYSGNTPTRAATEETTYTFSGWDKEIVPVKADVTYTARYEEVTNVYEISYAWSEDNSTVTATRKCTNNPALTVTETVNTEKTEKKPTCEEKGEMVYTAAFTNSFFSTQTKTTEEAALGHLWKVSEKQWSSDYSSITVALICEHDVSHTRIVNAQAVPEAKDGKIIYTAKVQIDGDEIVLTAEFPEISPEEIPYVFTQETKYWVKGSTQGAVYRVTRSAQDNLTYSLFNGIKVDGVQVSAYDKAPGSIIISLHPAYLNTLSAGWHRLTVYFTDGSVSTDFLIRPASSGVDPYYYGGTGYVSSGSGAGYTYVPPSNNPRTGDESNIALWGMLAIVSLAGVVLTGRKREKQ